MVRNQAAIVLEGEIDKVRIRFFEIINTKRTKCIFFFIYFGILDDKFKKSKRKEIQQALTQQKAGMIGVPPDTTPFSIIGCNRPKTGLTLPASVPTHL